MKWTRIKDGWIITNRTEPTDLRDLNVYTSESPIEWLDRTKEYKIADHKKDLYIIPLYRPEEE